VFVSNNPAIQLADEDPQSYGVVQEYVVNDSDHFSSSSSSTVDSKGDDEYAAVLRGYYEQIVMFVDKLFEIATLIRKASRRFRSSRAAVHIEVDMEGCDLLAEFKTFMRLKIQGLYPATPTWLCDRLSDVVGKRRQHFYYQ
jgi:hypothetical protein